MTECTNDTMQDLLPGLARGTLPPAEAASLRAHLGACAACAAEFAILERAADLFSAATPQVDVAAILAKLPSPPGARPALRVERSAPQAFRVPRYALAAAASVVLVATLSLAVLRPAFFGAPVAGVDIAAVDSGLRTPSTVPTALVGGADLADLDVDELTALLAELDRIEATVASEPISMRQPLAATPEGL